MSVTLTSGLCEEHRKDVTRYRFEFGPIQGSNSMQIVHIYLTLYANVTNCHIEYDVYIYMNCVYIYINIIYICTMYDVYIYILYKCVYTCYSQAKTYDIIWVWAKIHDDKQQHQGPKQRFQPEADSHDESRRLSSRNGCRLCKHLMVL